MGEADDALKKEGREKWVHEDILINHRLTWLGVTQGLLFTALGFAIHEQGTPNGKHLLTSLIWGIPLIGFCSSFFVLLGVLGAVLAMRKIRVKFFKGGELGISNLTTRLGWTCALGLPGMFVISWILVFFCA